MKKRFIKMYSFGRYFAYPLCSWSAAMTTSTQRQTSMKLSAPTSEKRVRGKAAGPATGVVPAVTRAAGSRPAAESEANPVQINPAAIEGVRERRRRRRVAVPPMYTSAMLRVLSQRIEPIEAHVIDVSENGIAVEADTLVPVGQVVTVEFQIAGLGALRGDQWAQYAAAAQVVRHDHLDDFPHGPHRMALRFVQISTMTQAQIARFVATHAS
jgi:hypothetical protein